MNYQELYEACAVIRKALKPYCANGTREPSEREMQILQAHKPIWEVMLKDALGLSQKNIRENEG